MSDIEVGFLAYFLRLKRLNPNPKLYKIRGLLKKALPHETKRRVARIFVHFWSVYGAPFFSLVRDILGHSVPQSWG